MEVQAEMPHGLRSGPISLAHPCARRGGSSAEGFPKRLFGLGKMVELALSPTIFKICVSSGLAPRRLPVAAERRRFQVTGSSHDQNYGRLFLAELDAQNRLRALMKISSLGHHLGGGHGLGHRRQPRPCRAGHGAGTGWPERSPAGLIPTALRQVHALFFKQHVEPRTQIFDPLGNDMDYA